MCPENEYNMNEKGFLIGVIQGRKRVFNMAMAERGKLLGACQHGNKEWVTLIDCICADGTTLPQTIIYQASSGNLQDTWLYDFQPEQHTCHFASSGSGWTNEDLGYSWLVNVFDRYTKKKARDGRDWRMLYVDGHSSYLNKRFIEYCLRHHIIVIIYPPQSTRRLQPLNVGCFARLASYYLTNLSQWIQNMQGPYSMSKREFFSIFWCAFGDAMTVENIQDAFKKTGIVPFDPSQVLANLKAPEHQQQLPRPSASSSGTSAVSKRGWIKIRALIEEAVSERNSKQVQELENILVSLQTQLAIVRAENEDLRKVLSLGKRRRQRGRGLFEDMREEVDGHTFVLQSSEDKLHKLYSK